MIQEVDIIFSISKHRYRLLLLWLPLLALLALIGCSGGNKPKENQTEEQEEQTDSGAEKDETVEDSQLYILLYSNPDTKHIFLESVDTGRQEEFEYNGGTYIRDRYGESTIIEKMSTGELIHISYTEKNLLTEIQVASETFVYDSLNDFRIDAEEAIITVAGSKYYYDEFLKIFSENGIISLNELSEKDTLCIRGVGKEILTVAVVRGHGTVTFRNTDVFEGGMVSIGNVAAQVITEDLVIEVPEGTYMLSAANDGYGGTMEITVNRFEELTVDLNAIKGEAPSYCILSFKVSPESASVALDGALLDYTKPLELKYGTYQLAAQAEGYEDWRRQLVVNSQTAEIVIDMDKASDTAKDEEEKEADSDSDKEEKEADSDSDKEEEKEDSGA